MILRYGFLTALFICQVRCPKPEGCDPSLNAWFREGILGQVGMFPWLGVIRVQLYEGVKVRIALTGAILIKVKFALAIADDIARIPRSVFRRDSKALFIPTDGEPWLCKLRNYTTHPEYATVQNTIALIELELEDKGPVPLVPICWPLYHGTDNYSDQLYVLGITDVNDILEKEVYKVQYVQPSACIEWYNREGFNSKSDRSRDYQCVSAENSKRQCVYETGMVLASNNTGTWSLLGFGIHGPGCSAPARFIEMYKYLPWIESTTSNNQIGRIFGKPALREGFGSGPEIPVHQLFRSGKETEANPSNRVGPWIFDRYESGLVPEIVRIDQNAIVLFDSKYELSKGDCFKTSKLIYTDSFKVHAERQGGKAYYQLSLMDLSVMNYTCVLVRVDAKKKSKTRLWYNYGNFIDPLDGVDETPKEIVKKYPVPERQDETTTAKSQRFERRLINNKSRSKNLISDSIINELLAIKNELETSRKELDITGKADIDKIFRKMFTVKGKLQDVRKKLGSPAPDCLKDSINILDKVASELRAGPIFYQGQLMNVRKQEIQQSIDLIKQFREQPETIEIETVTDRLEINLKEANQKAKAKGRTGKKAAWKPHKYLEPEYITDKPGWWLYYPHLNLELEFFFESEAELKIEVWSHLTKIPPSRGTTAGPTRTRNNNKSVTAGDENKNPTDNPPGMDSNNVQPGFDQNNLPPKLDPNNFPPEMDANNPPPGFPQNTIPPGIDSINWTFPKNPRSAGLLRNKLQLTKIRVKDSVPTTTNRSIANPRSNSISNYHSTDPPVNHSLAGERFLRNNTKLRAHSEFKGAEYDDLHYTKVRGIDIFDKEQTGESDIVRSEWLCVLALVLSIFLGNLFLLRV